MNFAPKQQLFLVTAFLLQAAIVFASPDEANTSSQTSEPKIVKVAEDASNTCYSVAELIEKLTAGNPEMEIKEFLDTFSKLPFDQKIATSIAKLAINHAYTDDPRQWIRHPSMGPYDFRPNKSIDMPTVKQEPWYKDELIPEIRYSKRFPGTPVLLVVDPESGNWVYGVLYPIRKMKGPKAKWEKMTSGYVKISNSVIFVPVFYYVKDSHQSTVKWKLRKREFDGVTEKKNHNFEGGPSNGFGAPRYILRATWVVSKCSDPKPFGLRVSTPSLGDDDDDDNIIYLKPIDDALIKGGVVGATVSETRTENGFEILANAVPQKLPDDLRMPEHLFSSGWLEDAANVFGYPSSFEFKSKSRFLGYGRKEESYKYRTDLWVPSLNGVKSYYIQLIKPGK